jgi:hypothetical protein
MPTLPKQPEYREGPRAAERFNRTLREVLGVSKEELAKREAEYQESRKHRVRPGPKSSKR